MEPDDDLRNFKPGVYFLVNAVASACWGLWWLVRELGDKNIEAAMHYSAAVHFQHEAGMAAFFAFAFFVISSATVFPAYWLVLWYGARGDMRSWIFFAAGGMFASIAELPVFLLVINFLAGGDVESWTLPIMRFLPIFLACGLVGGTTYWLVAGRGGRH